MDKWKLVVGAILFLLIIGGMWWLLRPKVLVTVAGEGSVLVPTGRVSLVVTTVAMGTSPGEAISQSDTTMVRMSNDIKKIMGNEVELRRSFYQITPQAEGKYIAASALSVKSANIPKVSDLIRFLYTAGANTVSGVTFVPDDENAARKQVQTAALQDAEGKAAKLALAMKKSLGRVVSVVDDDAVLGGSVNDGMNSDTNFSTVRIEKKMTVIYELR